MNWSTGCGSRAGGRYWRIYGRCDGRSPRGFGPLRCARINVDTQTVGRLWPGCMAGGRRYQYTTTSLVSSGRWPGDEGRLGWYRVTLSPRLPAQPVRDCASLPSARDLIASVWTASVIAVVQQRLRRGAVANVVSAHACAHAACGALPAGAARRSRTRWQRSRSYSLGYRAWHVGGCAAAPRYEVTGSTCLTPLPFTGMSTCDQNTMLQSSCAICCPSRAKRDKAAVISRRPVIGVPTIGYRSLPVWRT